VGLRELRPVQPGSKAEPVRPDSIYIGGDRFSFIFNSSLSLTILSLEMCSVLSPLIVFFSGKKVRGSGGGWPVRRHHRAGTLSLYFFVFFAFLFLSFPSVRFKYQNPEIPTLNF